MTNKTLNSHEILYAFAGWLTSRDEVLTMSSHHDAAPAAEAVAAFARSQELPPVRDDFAQRAKPYPQMAK